MSKFIILAVAVLLASTGIVAAQTKEDTVAWLIKQTTQNSSDLTHSVEDGVLESHVTLAGGIGGLADPISKGIPLGKVTDIVLTQTEKYVSFTLKCNTPCAYLLQSPELKRDKFLFEIYGNFDSTYSLRLQTALLHLVKLHGGNAKVRNGPLQKEPF
jgi:thiamine pyrophosphokinase